MNKPELVTALAGKAGMTKKDAEIVIKAFVEIVEEELAVGGEVKLVGFGTFSVAKRNEREGRNPKTGETMTIPATKAPKFKAGKTLKDLIKKSQE